jgi:hypothetical protein
MATLGASCDELPDGMVGLADKRELTFEVQKKHSADMPW